MFEKVEDYDAFNIQHEKEVLEDTSSPHNTKQESKFNFLTCVFCNVNVFKLFLLMKRLKLDYKVMSLFQFAIYTVLYSHT